MVTKRPHYVPAGYLRAWADNETVCCRRRDRAISFPTNVKNVAVEAGIYGTGSLGQAREDMFRQTEDDWPALRRRLTSTGDLHGNARTVVALFTAIQLIRTRESLARSNFIADAAASTEERPIPPAAIRRFLREQHLGFEPNSAEVEAAWTMVQYATDQDNPPSRDEVLGIMLEVAVTELAPRLEKMQWTVEHCSVPMLMTSDRPVMMWRRPNSNGDPPEEGIGLANADEIRLPLAPSELLVIAHQKRSTTPLRVGPKRFRAVNRHTAAQCYEFAAGTVQQKHRLDDLNLAGRSPVLRFNIAPGYQQIGQGAEPTGNDIIHTWIPYSEER